MTEPVERCGECGATLMAVGPTWRFCTKPSCPMYSRAVHKDEVASGGADMAWHNERHERLDDATR